MLAKGGRGKVSELSKSCMSGGAKHDAEPKGVTAEKNLAGVKHKIIVMSGKGGVGKSTVAVNLAVSLARSGLNVGLLDADMHGPSVPKLLGIPNLPLAIMKDERIQPAFVPPSLKVISIAFLLSDRYAPIIWRGPLKMGAIKQFLEEVDWGELDYLIIDLPPGTGDEPLSIAQLVPSPDGAVIVTTPQDVALLSVRKSINFAKAVNLRIIGIVENMDGFVCPHCGKEAAVFGGGGVQKAVKETGIDFLGSIPLSPEVSQSGDAGKPFILNGGTASKAFEEVVLKVIKKVDGGKR
jgi:ATP-binding protein involved in chromosome partitioning